MIYEVLAVLQIFGLGIPLQSLKITKALHFCLEADLGDTIGSIPDPHQKASITIK